MEYSRIQFQQFILHTYLFRQADQEIPAAQQIQVLHVDQPVLVVLVPQLVHLCQGYQQVHQVLVHQGVQQIQLNLVLLLFQLVLFHQEHQQIRESHLFQRYQGHPAHQGNRRFLAFQVTLPLQDDLPVQVLQQDPMLENHFVNYILQFQQKIYLCVK